MWLVHEHVEHHLQVMLGRRNYDIIDTKLEPIPSYTCKKKNNDEIMVVFIIVKQTNDKITNKNIDVLLNLTKPYTHLLVVHNSVLTSDANRNIGNCQNNVFKFEFFTFHELSFDLYECLFENIHDPKNCLVLQEKPKDWKKLPHLLVSDPLSRYLGLSRQDIVCGYFDGSCMLSLRVVV